MKRLIKSLVVLACLGCVNSKTPRIYYNNLMKFESVEVNQLGVGFIAPIDRFPGETSVKPILGCTSTRFRLHKMEPGPFTTYTTYKILIVIEVYTRGEWQRILNGDNLLTYGDNYGNGAKFCPNYLNHRRDVMSPDGRVAVTYALLSTWSFENRTNGEAEDELAIKRIVESVHFLEN